MAAFFSGTGSGYRLLSFVMMGSLMLRPSFNLMRLLDACDPMQLVAENYMGPGAGNRLSTSVIAESAQRRNLHAASSPTADELSRSGWSVRW